MDRKDHEERKETLETVSPADQSLWREFIQFACENKKFWMIPLILVLLLLGILLIVSGSSVAPFIYTLF